MDSKEHLIKLGSAVSNGMACEFATLEMVVGFDLTSRRSGLSGASGKAWYKLLQEVRDKAKILRVDNLLKEHLDEWARFGDSIRRDRNNLVHRPLVLDMGDVPLGNLHVSSPGEICVSDGPMNLDELIHDMTVFLEQAGTISAALQAAGCWNGPPLRPLTR